MCDIPAHEAFLKKFGQILHPNHVHIVMAKYPLAKMYGRMAGWEADKLTEGQLKRKQQLCEEVNFIKLSNSSGISLPLCFVVPLETTL